MNFDSTLYNVLHNNYKNKLNTLKSDPKKHVRQLVSSDNNLRVCKIKISDTYNKPNTYKATPEKLDLEIFEEIDPEKFNFTKASQNEHLLILKENYFIFDDALFDLSICDCDETDKKSDLIIPNIFPMTYLHCLLLPHFSDIRPQYINNKESLKRVLQFNSQMNKEDLM